MKIAGRDEKRPPTVTGPGAQGSVRGTRDQYPSFWTGAQGTQGGLVERTIQPETYPPQKARERQNRSPLISDTKHVKSED